MAAALPRALAAPLGFLAVQSIRTHTAPGISWIGDQLTSQPEVYIYAFFFTLLTLTVVGWRAARKEDHLEKVSVTDPLTGLANRRRLHAQMAEEMNRADRYGTPLALLLIDLDRLKMVNDHFGHSAGDRALQVVAEALRQNCRTTDLATRHGGDEFAVLAVNTTAREALALAQRILASVRHLSGAHLPLSVSIGVSDIDRTDAPGPEGLHASADQALYRAKNQGRDIAMVAPEKVRTGSHLRLVPTLSTPQNVSTQTAQQLTRA
ncbi:MAG TPA: GGDEF domain-containing protein [Polyangia bacterium]|nr:GGDEF domain-containing protein [Polyangia bacterium]